MKIMKRWNKDPDILWAEGKPVGWFETTLEECIEHTEDSGYWKPKTVKQILKHGMTVDTPFASYKQEIIIEGTK